MDFEATVETLSKRASENTALHDVLSVLSNRTRTRDLLSLRTLHRDVNAAGFMHSKDACSEVLSILASCGIGKAKKGNKGRIEHLTGVTVDLKHLGASVTNSSTKNTKKYKKESALEMLTKASKAVALDPESVKIHPFRSTAIKGLSISVSVNGKPLLIPIPEGFTMEEIQAIVEFFEDLNKPKK